MHLTLQLPWCKQSRFSKHAKGQRLVLPRRRYVVTVRAARTVTEPTLPGDTLEVVFLCTEIAPYSKVGGLADVMAALPAALAARGHRVMTVAPRYEPYAQPTNTGVKFPVELPPWCTALYRSPNLSPGRLQQRLDEALCFAGFYHERKKGVDHVFVDHPFFLEAASIYGDSSYAEYQARGADIRHNILSQAALAAPTLLWDDDVITDYAMQPRGCSDSGAGNREKHVHKGREMLPQKTGDGKADNRVMQPPESSDSRVPHSGDSKAQHSGYSSPQHSGNSSAEDAKQVLQEQNGVVVDTQAAIQQQQRNSADSRTDSSVNERSSDTSVDASKGSLAGPIAGPLAGPFSEEDPLGAPQGTLWVAGARWAHSEACLQSETLGGKTSTYFNALQRQPTEAISSRPAGETVVSAEGGLRAGVGKEVLVREAVLLLEASAAQQRSAQQVSCAISEASASAGSLAGSGSRPLLVELNGDSMGAQQHAGNDISMHSSGSSSSSVSSIHSGLQDGMKHRIVRVEGANAVQPFVRGRGVKQKKENREGMCSSNAGPRGALHNGGTSTYAVSGQGVTSVVSDVDRSAKGKRQLRTVFVANDWPTAPAILRLNHVYRRPRQHEIARAWRKFLLRQQDGQTDEPQQFTLRRYYETLLDLRQKLTPRLHAACSVTCVHNLAYQGTAAKASFGRMCLPAGALIPLTCRCKLAHALPSNFIGPLARPPEGPLGGPAPPKAACCTVINWLKAAIQECDTLVTVSPGYAAEIADDKLLEIIVNGRMQQKPVRGIMNGIDTQEWDPTRDPLLPPNMHYNAINMLHGKTLAKVLLQSRMGLQIDPQATLFAFIGRLTTQKGIDVLLAAAPTLLNSCAGRTDRRGEGGLEGGLGGAEREAFEGLVGQGQQRQLVVLGTGGMWEEGAVRKLAALFAGRAGCHIAFDEGLAHLLYAAADVLVVPSRFEPCGLVAQCAARYGAVPLVADTGGLGDLVTPDIGYTFPAIGPAGDAIVFRQAVDRLLHAMINAATDHATGALVQKQRACMQLQLSWEAPAIEWEQVLLELARE